MRRIFAPIILLMLVFASYVYAETNNVPAPALTLYQQPDAKSPVVSTIQPGVPIMPIITQGNWTKIADPNNGNVGWVSNEALKQQQFSYIRTITQGSTTPNGSNYKIVQTMGNSVNNQKLQEMMQNWQAQQAAAQQMFSQILQQNAANMATMAKEMQNENLQFPVIIPGVATPGNTQPAATPPAPPTQSAQPVLPAAAPSATTTTTTGTHKK